jgi:hypothetical protein
VKLVRKCGLKGIRLYDARHTHATIMLKQGVHPKIVQERLGHSSISTTLDTYSHVAPELQQAAANGFDDILKERSKLDEELEEIIKNNWCHKKIKPCNNSIAGLNLASFDGVPGGIRTHDPLLRRQPLYPTELQGHEVLRINSTIIYAMKQAK